MAKRSATARKLEELTDEALLREASEVLKKRLGLVGYLRYLRLTAGGRDSFQEIRKGWEKVSVDEVLRVSEASRKAF